MLIWDFVLKKEYNYIFHGASSSQNLSVDDHVDPEYLIHGVNLSLAKSYLLFSNMLVTLLQAWIHCY
jgi:hypothetical protein